MRMSRCGMMSAFTVHAVCLSLAWLHAMLHRHFHQLHTFTCWGSREEPAALQASRHVLALGTATACTHASLQA